MLHGRGGLANDFAWVGEALTAWVEPVGLQGPLEVRDRSAWFDMRRGGVNAAMAAAEALLERLDREFAGRQLALFGFSQGAAVVMNLLRLRPDGFLFAIALSGFLAPARHASDREVASIRPAVFSGHGDLDDVISATQARRAAEWLDRHTDHVQHRYPDLAHWVSDQEVRDIAAFVRAISSQQTAHDNRPPT